MSDVELLSFLKAKKYPFRWDPKTSEIRVLVSKKPQAKSAKVFKGPSLFDEQRTVSVRASRDPMKYSWYIPVNLLKEMGAKTGTSGGAFQFNFKKVTGKNSMILICYPKKEVGERKLMGMSNQTLFNPVDFYRDPANAQIFETINKILETKGVKSAKFKAEFTIVDGMKACSIDFNSPID